MKMGEWMKVHYPDLTDFDNLQFVKDCAEDGVKEYKKKVKAVIDKHSDKIPMEDLNDILKELGLR